MLNFKKMTDLIDSLINSKVWDKILLLWQKRPYTIKARSDRYIIATKPYNPQRTIVYTIIDLKEKWMWPNDRVFNPYDYAKQEDIEECLFDLMGNEDLCNISQRHWRPLAYDGMFKKNLK